MQDHTKKRILVVEDNVVSIKLMTHLLEKEGHHVIVAEDGYAALEILKSVTPDIIFLDLILPKINGDILTKVIRNKPKLVNCYIVIISATIVERGPDLNQIGADACIAKGPFEKMTPYIKECIRQAHMSPEERSSIQYHGIDGQLSRRITKELLQQNLHLRIILENLSEGIIELFNGKIIYINSAAASIVGALPEKLLGLTFANIFDDTLGSELNDFLSTDPQPNNSRQSFALEYHGKQLIINRQHINNDEQGLIILLKDITEQKRMESIAEAANLMDNIGYIFSGIRHEIGNPLNSIKMALTVLKKNKDSYTKETIFEFIDRAIIETSRIEYLLKALKSFSLFESPHVHKIRIDHFIDNFLSLIKTDFQNQGIAIKTHFLPDVKWSFTDPRALHHVLLNILTNAAHAVKNQNEPQIVLRLCQIHQWIQIQIEDNGCGISRKEQRNLFRPFFTTKTKGTGLGLVIVKKMLSKMNSTIHIKSYRDFGTTVTISLPGEQSNGHRSD